MDRLATGMRVVDVECLDFAIVEFNFGQDAIFVIGLEEHDRRHEGAGEVPGMLLCEGKIV